MLKGSTLFFFEEGYDLFVASGSSCFHLPGFTRKTKGQNWDEICTEGLRKAINFIKVALTPPVVVISHSWNAQMAIAGLIDKKGAEVGVEQITDGILRLKAQIGNAQLIVIGNVPGAGVNLYDVFTRPKPILFNGVASEAYLYNPADKELMEFNKELERVADLTGAYKFVDPFDYLCHKDKCRNTDDHKRLIYSDAGHLSKYGSLYMVKAIQPEIEHALIKRLEE